MTETDPTPPRPASSDREALREGIKATPEMLAATALADENPTPADYALAQQAIALLPPTNPPQVLEVMAAMACDLRVALALLPLPPVPSEEQVEAIIDSPAERLSLIASAGEEA